MQKTLQSEITLELVTTVASFYPKHNTNRDCVIDLSPTLVDYFFKKHGIPYINEVGITALYEEDFSFFVNEKRDDSYGFAERFKALESLYGMENLLTAYADYIKGLIIIISSDYKFGLDEKTSVFILS